MTDDTLERDTIRSDRARQLLDDPLLNEGFSVLRDELIKAWLDSPIRDVEGRERLFHYVKLIDKLKGWLATVVETGGIAQYQIEALRRDRESREDMNATERFQRYSAELRD